MNYETTDEMPVYVHEPDTPFAYGIEFWLMASRAIMARLGRVSRWLFDSHLDWLEEADSANQT